MGWVLKIVENGAPERCEPLSPDRPVVVGTDPSRCGVVLRDSKVSGVHAEFRVANGRVLVCDPGSTNGTFLDGARLPLARAAPTPIPAAGASLRLGPAVRIDVAAEDGAGPIRQPSSAAHPSAEARSIPARPGKGRRAETAATRDYRKRIRGLFVDRMNRVRLDQNDPAYKGKIEAALDDLLREEPPPGGVALQAVRESLLDDVFKLGPLQPYLDDSTVDEIMVQSRKTYKHHREHMIFVERNDGTGARIEDTGDAFEDTNQLMTVIERIVSPLGKRVDESSPLVDARLPDGSRVNAIIRPLAIDGPSLTIRKFKEKGFSVQDLIERQSIIPRMATFLELCVVNKLNVLISGGTGSGKTTLLNVLASFIPEKERIVTIEDAAELQLPQLHVVRLESRPPNIEEKGAVTIRDLVRNALRMRPDRIVVGECRGGEAIDMIQAMNTGHDGSLTTAHANSPRDALRRIGVMCLMADLGLPHEAIREMIVSSLQIVVQVRRMPGGSRKVTNISEITGMQGDQVSMQDIFKYEDGGLDAAGHQQGRHVATGCVPLFAERLRERHVDVDAGLFKRDD